MRFDLAEVHRADGAVRAVLIGALRHQPLQLPVRVRTRQHIHEGALGGAGVAALGREQVVVGNLPEHRAAQLEPFQDALAGLKAVLHAALEQLGEGRLALRGQPRTEVGRGQHDQRADGAAGQIAATDVPQIVVEPMPDHGAARGMHDDVEGERLEVQGAVLDHLDKSLLQPRGQIVEGHLVPHGGVVAQEHLGRLVACGHQEVLEGLEGLVGIAPAVHDQDLSFLNGHFHSSSRSSNGPRPAEASPPTRSAGEREDQDSQPDHGKDEGRKEEIPLGGEAAEGAEEGAGALQGRRRVEDGEARIAGVPALHIGDLDLPHVLEQGRAADGEHPDEAEGRPGQIDVPLPPGDIHRRHEQRVHGEENLQLRRLDGVLLGPQAEQALVRLVVQLYLSLLLGHGHAPA